MCHGYYKNAFGVSADIEESISAAHRKRVRDEQEQTWNKAQSLSFNTAPQTHQRCSIQQNLILETISGETFDNSHLTNWNETAGILFSPKEDPTHQVFDSGPASKEEILFPSDCWKSEASVKEQSNLLGLVADTHMPPVYLEMKREGAPAVRGEDTWRAESSRSRRPYDGEEWGEGEHGPGGPDEDFSEISDPVLRRRLQNREASARFRARGKQRDQQLNKLRAQVESLTQRNTELQKELVALKENRASEVLRIQESTMMWIMSKFRLKRKISFRSVVQTVTRTMALHRAVSGQQLTSSKRSELLESNQPAVLTITNSSQ